MGRVLHLDLANQHAEEKKLITHNPNTAILNVPHKCAPQIDKTYTTTC